MKTVLYFIALTFLLGSVQAAEGDSWWPVQKAPEKVVICTLLHQGDVTETNLAQSLAGLAAQRLNDGLTSEGVWIKVSGIDYSAYYKSLIFRTKAKEVGSFNVWDLTKRYADNGIIKGYVLYDLKRQDNSINVATVQAGLHKGVLIDISQEEKVRKLGLTKLYDATTISLDKEIYKQLIDITNKRLLVLANPKFPNNRDYAIAHKAMVYYGVDSIFESIIKVIQPLSPVIGWNKGDEFKQIAPCTKYGLINTASDWCWNFAILSAVSSGIIPKVASVNPLKIDFTKDGNYHSFVMSDGDNMQWTMGGFINNDNYWSSSYNSNLAMSFTSCPLNLAQAAADVYASLISRQPSQSSVVEYGAGYYYPDLFAKSTDNPEKWLRKYAAMINRQMKKTGTKVFGFICKDVSGNQAMKAYEIYAQEIDDLTGMIAVQYNPYNGGYGKVYWVKNKQGVEIPVLTARYQLWANLNKRGSGGPDSIATFINRDAADTTSQLSWTIVHAWSRFTKSKDGTITDADNNDIAGTRGVTPVKWTADKINHNTMLVNIEELLWRMRMKHNSVETRKVIAAMQSAD